MKIREWLKLMLGFKNKNAVWAGLVNYGGQGRDKFGN